VSLFEAARRVSFREPVVRRQGEEGAEFIMSLSPGEAVEYPDGDRAGIWIVQGVWSSGRVVLESAVDAEHATTTRPTANSFLKDGAKKISIDPIGQIRKASD
jgi:CRISPR-associated endonuclease Csn1